MKIKTKINLKEKLIDMFGTAGAYLFAAIGIFITIYPLIFINTHFLLNILFVLLSEIFHPFKIPLWIWGLIEAMQKEQNAFTIIYYILFAIGALKVTTDIIIFFFKLFQKKDY